MELKQAQKLAGQIVAELAPHCERIEVVGSIRRQRPFPRDIDILLVPGNQGRLAVALYKLGEPKKAGTKYQQREYKGEQVDIYIATPETWFTLLLIRTGSVAHNIKLTVAAKNRGWHLYADGRGLFNSANPPERIAGNTDESFFEALGLDYAGPLCREAVR